MAGPKSPAYTSWCSHLGTATLSVSNGIVTSGQNDDASTLDLINDAPYVWDICAKMFDSILVIENSDVRDIQFILPLYSDSWIGRYLDSKFQDSREFTPNFEIGSRYEVFSLSFADQKANEFSTNKMLPESKSALLPNSRIIKKYTGIDEVIRNIERLSLSDKEKRDLPVDWINNPQSSFTKNGMRI
ncbi:hypothetical protein AYI68_g401 [Smittium mucronatum]|uniref:Uncharacterized protein n=1 Tax=Smittium mucronatum TaxID=133383 RepID=A0A1R0H8B3_9FUNG|nr:hypothetical protein AYI68_g401 [Smittium mucronatum]